MFGMAPGAEDGQARAVRRIVREVDHVEQAVRLVAHLADVASGFQHGQPEFLPAGAIIFPVFGSNGHFDR
jgi:hypothetical protein